MYQDVAALYVDTNKGPYPEMGLDCWDESRDARRYSGSAPVIAHPPCGRWCGMAKLNERRWGAKVGDDGGCFEAALSAVRANGGVLEHPARSLAWPKYGLTKPSGLGWNQVSDAEWAGEVWQSAYGHAATKRTWLLYVGSRPPLPFKCERPRGTHQIGGGVHTGNRNLPRLRAGTHLTPPEFAHYLAALARHSRQTGDSQRGNLAGPSCITESPAMPAPAAPQHVRAHNHPKQKDVDMGTVSGPPNG